MFNYLIIVAIILLMFALKLSKFVILAIVIALLIFMIVYNLKKQRRSEDD